MTGGLCRLHPRAGAKSRRSPPLSLKGLRQRIGARRCWKKSSTMSVRIISMRFPSQRLRPGRYVYAVRLAASMNAKRTSLRVSRPFFVR